MKMIRKMYKANQRIMHIGLDQPEDFTIIHYPTAGQK
jgi:hypothetical protein